MMVRAHSLLYAIYVCLIVSLLCGALLYMANLYNQLNLYYLTHEELYIQNQSLVNYALDNMNDVSGDIPDMEENGVKSSVEIKQYGLLTVLKAQSFISNDTVSSAHFAGQYISDKTGLYLTNFSNPLSFSGKVTITGDKMLPSEIIKNAYIENKENVLTAVGSTAVSEKSLPRINAAFRDFFNRGEVSKIDINTIEKHNDSIYLNSFFSETKELQIGNVLSNVAIKGNFILHAKDSVYIKSSAILEDVIIIAPKITFETGFKGNLQAFATKGIEVGEEVELSYPSVLCVYNVSLNESKIKIKKDCRINGALVLFGFPIRALHNNYLEIDKGGLIVGDIYCEGMLDLKSDIYGAVFTNKFNYHTDFSDYENCIADIEINLNKRPAYFVSVPLFEVKKNHYGLVKKLL